MKTTLIKRGTVVTQKSVATADILVRGEQIQAVGDLRDETVDEVVDAEGMVVLPGAVDSHVHFNDRFMGTVSVHDYFTGTRAAAFGGVTSVIDFSNQGAKESLVSTIETKEREAEGETLIDWGIHPVITRPDTETLEQIPLVVEKGAPTIKCYMTYRDEGLLIEERDLRRISRALAEAGGLLMVHAEDDEMLADRVPQMIEAGRVEPIYHAKSRPIEVENRAVERCIAIAKATGGRVFIVHLASAEGLALIRAAQNEGTNVFCETCTHYLLFTEEMLKREDGIKWICSPPLRDQANQERLWQGIAKGTIAMVTSDDAAYSWEAKLLGKDRFDRCPNGIPGIEPRLNLLYSEGVVKGRLNLPQLAQIIAAAPAKFFGLWPKKGNLSKGADADIVLLNPNEKWTMNTQTLHMATDWSAYEGIEVNGKIDKVFSRGELIIDGETCLAQKGRGKYLHRRLEEFQA